MINKLTQFFSASRQTAANTPEPQMELSAGEIQTGSAPAAEQPSQPASAPENISLLQLCDAKLAKFTCFFSGAEQKPAAAENAPPQVLADTTPIATAEISAAPQTTVAAENVSLLKLCDAKLSKLTRLFTGAVQAETPDVITQDSAAEVHAAPLESQATTHEISAAEAELAPQPSFTQQSLPPETEPGQDLKLTEQWLAFEQRLEQHINDMKNAETELSAFKAEIQQQIASHFADSGQQLLDHKNTLDLMLKNAFKRIADSHAALENKFSRQIDPLQQILDTLQDGLAEAGKTLHSVAEQTLRLQENMLRLSTAFETFKTEADFDSLNARVSALENPPKRKSWFRKK
ncbi:MAG: hypothetical protein ACU837_14570 [Gammaproteobacteria bacterium]